MSAVVSARRGGTSSCVARYMLHAACRALHGMNCAQLRCRSLAWTALQVAGVVALHAVGARRRTFAHGTWRTACWRAVCWCAVCRDVRCGMRVAWRRCSPTELGGRSRVLSRRALASRAHGRIRLRAVRCAMCCEWAQCTQRCTPRWCMARLRCDAFRVLRGVVLDRALRPLLRLVYSYVLLGPTVL